jgi:23S rRNA (adenine2503-C2)-methyltransferase
MPFGLAHRIGYARPVLTDIKSQTAEELQAQFQSWGQPTYRVGQVLDWLYVHRVTDWEAMTNLPKTLRGQLRDRYSLGALELVREQGSLDTTQKFLWRLDDHSLIESVLIPASPALYGEASDRHTLCVSTQVGCAYGCKFCASGLEGWKRNLRVEEIVEQVLAVERASVKSKVGGEFQVPSSKFQVGGESKVQSPKSKVGEEFKVQSSKFKVGEEFQVPSSKFQVPSEMPETEIQQPESRVTHHASRLVSNLVIMGMGEPLANYENLLKALKILNAPWGGRIGARKITISTSGLVPQIRRLADEPSQFRLAISLHGATDATRNQIMPVNRKYPLKDLTAACEYYVQKRGRMITFEYILIAGVNDGPEQANPLAALARRLNAKVNLIPYNKVEGLQWERPAEEAQEAFLEALQRQKITATLRREKGTDIDAACGQLRLKTEREMAL